MLPEISSAHRNTAESIVGSAAGRKSFCTSSVAKSRDERTARTTHRSAACAPSELGTLCKGRGGAATADRRLPQSCSIPRCKFLNVPAVASIAFVLRSRVSTNLSFGTQTAKSPPALVRQRSNAIVTHVTPTHTSYACLQIEQMV
jgi:hypothetical protein